MIVVFEEDDDTRGRRRTVKIDGVRVCGRGRETRADVTSLLFDPTKISPSGWFFLIPSSAAFKGATRLTDVEPERARWTKAVRVHSVTQAVAMTKLIWHGLFDVAIETLKKREAQVVQEKTDQAVAFRSNGIIDTHWLLNLGAVYLSAYSQYFSEKEAKPSLSELSKYTDLVVVDKRRARGCKEESLLVSGTNIMGCSIAKALKLVAAATRRLESSGEHIHFKSMKQR